MGAVTDTGESDEWAEWAQYRIIVSRDGPRWMATAHGPGLPETGRSTTIRSLADLDDAASTLLEQADTPAPRNRRSWHYEYHLGPDTGDVLVSFGEAERAYYKAQREWAGRGHQIASALAAEDKATLREIAKLMGVDYWEAALLLAYRPRPHQLMSFGAWGGPFRRREVMEWAAYEAKWRIRVLRLVAEDKIR